MCLCVCIFTNTKLCIFTKTHNLGLYVRSCKIIDLYMDVLIVYARVMEYVCICVCSTNINFFYNFNNTWNCGTT